MIECLKQLARGGVQARFSKNRRSMEGRWCIIWDIRDIATSNERGLQCNKFYEERDLVNGCKIRMNSIDSVGQAYLHPVAYNVFASCRDLVYIQIFQAGRNESRVKIASYYSDTLGK